MDCFLSNQHSGNVLIHERKIKIADFGLAKNLDATLSTANRALGVIPFTEPQLLNDETYIKDEKSDVYRYAHIRAALRFSSC